jgi:hypothetical protein
VVVHEWNLDEEIARRIPVAILRAYVALALGPSGEEGKKSVRCEKAYS